MLLVLNNLALNIRVDARVVANVHGWMENRMYSITPTFNKSGNSVVDNTLDYQTLAFPVFQMSFLWPQCWWDDES